MADIELANGVASLPRDEWNALVADESPFLEWDWLASLEHASAVSDEAGWGARPLVVREEGRLVAACPLYVKAHSEGEFVFDWGWADAAHNAGIDYYPKLVAGIPFTPVTGARLLVAPNREPAPLLGTIAAALRSLCVGNELSGVHVNFCLESEIEPLVEEGFLPRVGIQYHWQNHDYATFDDYLAHFRSKRRNQIRRERRELERQGVETRAHVGDDIPDALFEPMFRFYLSTIRNRAWGRQYLNMELFEMLRQRFKKRLVFIVAWQDGEPIAGTFNVCKGDALYGRYWGTSSQLRYLHFNVCYYAAIEYCIEAGLQRFEPGAGGDYKQIRGFDAQATWSAHYLTDPRLAKAVERFLESERAQASETIDWLRDHSALKSRPR